MEIIIIFAKVALGIFGGLFVFFLIASWCVTAGEMKSNSRMNELEQQYRENHLQRARQRIWLLNQFGPHGANEELAKRYVEMKTAHEKMDKQEGEELARLMRY